MTRYAILAALASQRWLIDQERGMQRILGMIPEHLPDAMAGDLFAFRLEAAERAAAVRAARPNRNGAAGILQIHGPIVRHESWFTMLFGGTSVEWLIGAVREMAADESISAIVLDVDSPGGTISGLPELATVMRAARDVKPVLTITNDLNCSAAYWISSQADEIMSTPEGLTGSVGVYTEHWDLSAMLEAEGIGHEFIQFGQFKTEGSEFGPLDDAAREHVQGIVDDGGQLFLADVAKGRGITASAVQSGYGEGRVFTAKDAKAAGLIDRVGTFADAVNRATNGKVPRRALAEDDRSAEAILTAPNSDEVAAAFDFERERRRRLVKPA